VFLRRAAVGLLAMGVSGCALLNQTVQHQVSWEPPKFDEVSRESAGVELRFEMVEGVQWVTALEQVDCIEEATQHGVEHEEKKPKDWLLAMGAFLGGGASAAAIGLLGGALAGEAVGEARNGQQSTAGQAVGTAMGLAGTVAQLLLYRQILQGLNAIRFERDLPLTQVVGRKVRCESRPLFRARVAD
jgi:hypothetical protein